ncbi:MAG: hypothetical protein C5B57_07010 [Blastocatellia bacterium]|nr:MAG: hypothetical protein C5B57_07010 [Blastocatellia bacterium]
MGNLVALEDGEVEVIKKAGPRKQLNCAAMTSGCVCPTETTAMSKARSYSHPVVDRHDSGTDWFHLHRFGRTAYVNIRHRSIGTGGFEIPKHGDDLRRWSRQVPALQGH